jgi:divalent metal cation (Fe/Co/Zn/Cd) transporter
MTVFSIPATTDDWKRRAVLLSWLTVIYNLLEGFIAVFFGLESESVSLAGFGLDSFLEVFSALIVLWLMNETKTVDASVSRESISLRMIGWLLITLATVTVIGAVVQLKQNQHPTTTIPGVLVSLVSLSFMFYLYRSKVEAGTALNSPTLLADAECSRSCMWLSWVLLAGSLIYWAFPMLGWVDSVAAIVLSFFIAREGLETLRQSKNPADACCHDH